METQDQYIEKLEETLESKDLRSFFEIQKKIAKEELFTQDNPLAYKDFLEITQAADFMYNRYIEVTNMKYGIYLSESLESLGDYSSLEDDEQIKEDFLFEAALSKHNEHLVMFSIFEQDLLKAKRIALAKKAATKFRKLYKKIHMI